MPVSLREWQRLALDRYHAEGKDNFLVTATPGAGKTTFALELARQLRPSVRRIMIIVPTSHLRTQWARAAKQFGIDLDDTFSSSSGTLAKDFHGAVVTYQAVASMPPIYRRLCENAFVVLDEVHHAGDQRAWGDALREACDPAKKRLLLSGTPFRSDSNPIPYVEYVRDADGVHRSQADYTYGYGDGVRDSVVRPVAFPAFDGEARWRDAGTVVQGPLHNDDETSAKRALRAAIQPNGDWIKDVLTEADKDLTSIRENTTPDAGGLVVANDQTLAREYSLLLERISGEAPAVAISDDPDASDTIRRFTNGTSRWLIAVQMVSEGVDIPRLAVGVYASRTTTALFFQQVVGRFVRTRGAEDYTCATLYLPSIRPLLRHAAELEQERDHVLADKAEATQHEDNIDSSDGASLFTVIEPIGASSATHYGTILSGEQYTETEIAEAERKIAEIGGGARHMLPAEMAQLIRNINGGQPAPSGAVAPSLPEETETLSERKHALRQIIQKEVSRLARTTGRQYSHIHNDLNDACNEQGIKQATIDTLERRVSLLNTWTRTAHGR